jgi:hypothetical protein
MDHPALLNMIELAQKPEKLDATVEYLAEKLHFLRKNEKVLICFAQDRVGCLGDLMEQAVIRREADPIMVGSDWRWKTILWLAFSNRVSTIIAPPLIVLGLSKLAKYKRTPLYIRNVVTAGYPCQDWMIDGIIRGLDCRTWGCFGSRGGSVIAGFSCGKSRGVHLRDEEYGVRIQDEAGREVPEGEVGEMILYPLADPQMAFPMGERARIDRTPCPCGCPSPRLMDMNYGSSTNPDLAPLGQHLQSWTSVLDCRLKKSAYGLEMEILTFPGEKLPKLPTAAKMMIRTWDPEVDEPFFYVPGIENM